MKQYSQPPKWARRFLRWFCAEELVEEIEGDLAEAYQYRKETHGQLKAKLWYVSDVFKFFKPYSFEKYSRTKQYIPMFKNYIIVSFRNILKRKGFTAINMLGLSIGITSVILVGLYINHEVSYDQQFDDSDNIYRLVNNYRDQTYSCMYFNNYFDSDYETQMGLINHLKSYDGVTEACHFVTNTSAIGPGSKWYVSVDNKEFVRDDFLFTNTGMEFQGLFPQQFVIGNPESAFADFQTVVLTESLAEIFYGSDWRYLDLMTREIKLGDEVFKIGGIVKDVPGNTHFDFGMIVHQQQIPSWGGYTYYKTKANVSGQQIVNQLNANIELVYPGYTDDVLSKGVETVPLESIHFTDNMLYEIKPTANPQYLLIFGVVGLVILLIIWTNYANLSIATYAGRQKELGVRKVMGARGKDVALQIMIEAILITLLCLPFIVGFVFALLPFFNELLGISISNGIVFQPIILLMFIGILFFTGLVSGAYPAIVFSKKSMLHLFDGKLSSNSKVGRVFQFRRVLLTSQFVMLIGLMSLAIIIMQQMQFVSSKALGFEKEGVVYFEVDGYEKFELIKQQLLEMPEIKALGSGMVPGQDMYNQLTYKMNGSDEIHSDGTFIFTSLGSMEVYGIESTAFKQLKEGNQRVFIINESAAQKLASDLQIEPVDLIGKTLVREPEWEHEGGFGQSSVIADILEDFDYFSLKYEAQPLLIEVHNQTEVWTYNMVVKVETNDWVRTGEQIEEAYLGVEEDRPFDLTFLDNHLDRIYEKERNAGKLASGLTLVCIILSIMGLVGIVGFITHTRRKEIGVRKVFGASVAQILGYIGKEYLVMIFLATIVSIPAATYMADQWLQSFAYRINPSFLVVILSGLIALVIVSVVVISQSYKSANLNPADTLRNE